MLKDINGETIANSVDLNYIFNDIGVYHIALEAYSNDTLCESQSISKTISVFCPIQACIGDEVIDQYLHFEHCAENVDNFLWIIYSGENEVLYESTEPQDSYYINNVDYVRLCLTASSEFCEDDICEYITITNDGSEICNNGIDDDGDGLIDLFDPDCPCNETAYQAQCPTECEILPDEFPNIKMKLKWESEFFTSNTSFPKAYVDGDTVLIILDKYELTGYDPQFGTPLYNIEPGLLYGEDGMKKKNASNFHSSNSFSVFRNSASNMIVDISANRRSDNLYIDKIESNQITTSASLGDVYSKNRGSVADINGDGIVEIIFGTTIINSNNMAILAEGSAGSGCQGTAFTDCNYIHTVVADFLPSPGLELAAGNTVYGIELNNLDGKVGNVMTPIMCDGPAFDGVTSYGDFDLDGWLDVVSLREFSHPEGGGLFIWDPRTEKVMAKNDLFFSLSRGYAPHVNDLDHDCIPEIIIPFQDKIIIYKYNAPNLEIWYEISIEDSGNANVTTFDLNQDGYPEIIHRDEEFLRIIEGTTGITIDSTQLFSRTAREYPIIVDVDLDGQAEILISGYTTMEEESRLYCFESAVGPWAPARSVWNQYAYNPTMVNDDLTISRYPQNPAQPLQGTENCPRETCSTPYNNFMVQATYRTQEGCYVWPELQRDLSVTASSRCVGDSLEICFYASSTDMTTVRNGVEISCYAPPWDNGSDSLIDVVTITQDTTCIMMPVMDGLDSMMIVINDDGGYYPPDFPNTDITECDYTNNEYVLDIRGPDLVVDILDYQCIGDSLIITLATDNIGAAAYANDPCIPVHLFYDTIYMDGEPLVFTTIACCFHWSDEGNMILDLIDTFNFTISLPMDVDQVCFSLNGGGIDFFLDDESDMMFAECDISNNYDCIDVDFEEKNLDLGPDMMKCETEVITLYAGPEFASYLWNDLTTDSIYSSSYEGLHYVEATDQCGRIYRDTVEIIYDPSGAIDLGEDRTICSLSEEMIEITGAYDSIFWYPSAVVDCDTCRLVALDITEETMLIVQGFNGDCVSTDSILLMMVVPEQDTIKEERCENDFIDFYDQQITTSGYYTHLTEDCQQLITLEAVFSSKDTAMITQSICMGDSYPFDGSQLTESGFYEKIELNAKGCDSLVMLQLSVVDEILASEVKTICEGDSIEIFGTWEKLADIYEASFESSAGCDSTHQVTLMVDERYQIEVSRSICQGDSTEVGGIWYKEKGVYPLALLTHGGCDSMVTVVIEENQSYNDIIDKEICVGGSYDFDGQSIVESGVYTADFTTSSGCDSVITLELSIVDNIRDSLRYELCEGDSMEVFGDWIMEDYSGTRSYESLAGCDSIVHVSVALLPVFTIIENYILCPDETLIIHGEEVVTGGSYDVTFTSILGCDSTYTITIEEISPPPLPVMKLDCEEESIIMSMPSTLEEAWSIRWSNALSEQSSVYEAIGGEEHVQLTQSGCEVVYKFDIPVLPDFGSLPTLPDTLTDQGSVLTFDLGLDVTIWEANWSTSLPQSCSSCMQNNITATDDEEVIIAVMHLETGCTYDVVFQIMVLGSDISVPNVFSPDAIGNQTWRPSLPDGYDIIEVYIYDRWGNQVAVLDEQNDYTWDGRYKNRDVMEGVYVYLLKATNLSGEMKIYKGDVTVMR